AAIASRLVPRQLRLQPAAVLGQEAFAGDEAGTRRQGQARAALVDAQLQPSRARIAHALHGDAAAVVQRQVDRVALNALRGAGDQAAWRGRHGVILRRWPRTPAPIAARLRPRPWRSAAPIPAPGTGGGPRRPSG